MSFDVFDTSILRLLKKPTDLFSYVSFVIGDPSFTRRRVEAETQARLTSEKRDVNLSEIYENLNEGYSKKLETETEKIFCVRNPEIYEFYKRALSLGKAIYFISDVYLEKDFIEDLLKNCGFYHYDGLFVSSEDGLIKGDGSRFEWLRNNKVFPEGRIIHIGDNYIADYYQPINYGFDSFHYLPAEEYYKTDPFIKDKIEYFESVMSLGLSFILGTYRYWNLDNSRGYKSYWRKFGFFYGGALLVRFCYFIHDQILEIVPKNGKIYFLGRDGEIMSKVYKALFTDHEVVNLLVSRRSVLFPVIEDLDYKFPLNYFLEGISSGLDFIDKLGYEDDIGLADDIDRIYNQMPIGIINALNKHKGWILDKVKEERNNLYSYFLSVGLLNQEKIILVDTGWGGTIQYALSKLLKIWGCNNEIIGFYLGVNDKSFQPLKMKGFLFSNTNPGRYGQFLELIELITSSPMDPIYYIDHVNGDITYESGKITTEEMKRQVVSKEIQKGILDFVKLVKDRSINFRFLNSDDFYHLLYSLKRYPSQDDMKHLSQINHSRLIGNKYEFKIVDYGIYPERSEVKIITVSINSDMYHKFFLDNSNINHYHLIFYDNTKSNYGLPKIYNEIINRFLNENCWLFFVHEDLEIKEDLQIINSLDPTSIYGTFGVRFENDYVPVGYGKHICSNKDGSEAVEVGVEVMYPEIVSTLDCQSILIHTELLRKFPSLRFDESLTFDLYAEDICINARSNFGIDIKVFPLKFQHYSHGKVTERYLSALKYLEVKYPDIVVPGSCSFIGGKSKILEEKFTYNIKARQDK